MDEPETLRPGGDRWYAASFFIGAAATLVAWAAVVVFVVLDLVF